MGYCFQRSRPVFMPKTLKSQRSLVRMAGWLMLVGAAWTLVPPPSRAATAEETQAELKEVRTRIESVRKSMNADVARRDAMTSQLKSAELDIQSARQQLADARTARAATERR